MALLALIGTGSAAADLTDSNETVEIEDINDSVVVDVEFNDSFVDSTTYNGSTFAELKLYDENNSLVGTSNITVNGTDINTTRIAVESNTVWFTEKFTDFQESSVGNITVELADDGGGVNSTAVSVDSSDGLFGGGILGGASRNQVLLGVVLLVVGVLAFRRMDGS
jgi:hypothetical protein